MISACYIIILRCSEQISPEISTNSSANVHHIIIYLCNELNNTFLGDSAVCEDTHIDIRSCRGSEILAAWAVGGEVNNISIEIYPI